MKSMQCHSPKSIYIQHFLFIINYFIRFEIVFDIVLFNRITKIFKNINEKTPSNAPLERIAKAPMTAGCKRVIGNQVGLPREYHEYESLSSHD